MELIADLHHPGNCWLEMELMEVDGTNESSETMPKINGNGIHLPEVSPKSSGYGLPYAPINWPNPGDNRRWKVGKRVAIKGHFVDRYLYLPKRLSRDESSTVERGAFASKHKVESYIREAFPNADINAFFASFSWKIPVKQLSVNGNVEGRNSSPPLFKDTGEDPRSDSQSDNVVCKAGNKKCNSLVLQAEYSSLTAMPCDICCIEPQFCGNCCCILCDKFINLNYGGYSYIKCEAQVGEGYMCGHVAHLNCALRCFMAGTIGGSIGLDAEYCCRRCDAKTDLILHATRLVRTCKSVDCQDDIEKILKVGVCILHGSQKTSAKELLSHIELAIKKLKHGTSLGDIWKVEDSDVAIPTGLEENKAKLTSLRQEYNEMMETATLLQTEIDSSSSSIQGIDDQIAQLKSRQAELTMIVRTRKMAKFNVLFNQKKLAEAITRTEDEILLSEARKSQMGAEEGKCSHA
ncbi:hypothetical protein Q3G72_025646 [Acer saccharum]|nr:hypothetical protein Q3G72_025646 [Acer saccharum]